MAASILSAPTPPMHGLPAPEGVGPIIAACLEKSPDLRWQNVRDIKLALKGAAARPDASGSCREIAMVPRRNRARDGSRRCCRNVVAETRSPCSSTAGLRTRAARWS